MSELASPDSQKRKFIADLSDGDVVHEVFLIRELQERTTRDGSHYVTMELADRTGWMKAVLWSYSPEKGRLEKNQFVEVKGVVGTYNNQLQLRLLGASPYPDDRVSVDDFLRRTDKDISRLLDKIVSILSDVKDPHLDGLVKSFLSDTEFMVGFRRAPAAQAMHHPFIGGLIEHTHNVVRLCRALSLIYPHVDADLLTVGAFVHDVGKIKEYDYARAIEFSTVGRLKTHMLLGCEMLREHVSRIADFPEKLAVKLEHIILSHHGLREWGSPVEPLFIEASLIHFADNLDAKAFMFDEARRNAAQTGQWSQFSRELQRYVYLE